MQYNKLQACVLYSHYSKIICILQDVLHTAGLCAQSQSVMFAHTGFLNILGADLHTNTTVFDDHLLQQNSVTTELGITYIFSQ